MALKKTFKTHVLTFKTEDTVQHMAILRAVLMAAVTNCHYLCHKLSKDNRAFYAKPNAKLIGLIFLCGAKGERKKNPL